jgi:hypothetical protein
MKPLPRSLTLPQGEKEMLMKIVKQRFWTTILAVLLLVNFSASAMGAVKQVKGQTVYIPSYANVISGPPIYMVVPLRANLVIHNTDPDQSITIAGIDEYNTEGKKVRSYLTAPVTLNPLGAMRVVVKESKKETEGLGANFIIQWQAEKKVTEPIIECLIIGSLGAQGFSFVTQGRIIKEQTQ